VVPRFDGRRGHPVFFGPDPLDEVLALESGQGANQVVRRRPDRVVEVEVEDPAVVSDLDTPAEFEHWQSKHTDL
jgi:molybdenum cofactor cytidylyltransferase